MDSVRDTEVKITEEQFAELLEEKIFVDFFNVFLSQPVFHQRLLYKIKEKDFEFDPYIKRTQYRLRRNGLTQWLYKERLRFFTKTELYLQYMLCKKLIAPDNSCREQDAKIKSRLGHVLGMCQFHQSLHETPGQNVMNMWFDIERYKKIPQNDSKRRHTAIRLLQTKYFYSEGLLNLAEEKWKVLLDYSSTCEAPVTFHRTSAKQRAMERKIRYRNAMQSLQDEALLILKSYWLPRYALHCDKIAAEAKLQNQIGDDTTYVKSETNLDLLGNIEDSEKFVKLAQGNLDENPVTADAARKLRWTTMFPEYEDLYTEDTTNEVITLHDDGHVTLDPLASRSMNELLHQYLNEDSSSSEDRSPSPTIDRKKVKPAPVVLPDPASIHASHDPQFHPETNDLIQKIYIAEAESWTRQVKEYSLRKEPPPYSHPVIGEKVHKKLKCGLILPKILPKTHCSMAYEHGDSHLALKLPQIHPTSITESPLSRRLELTTPTFKFSNTANGTFRFDNRIFVCALASDRVAGSPFQNYLLENKLGYMLKYVYFWNDLHEYLSICQQEHCEISSHKSYKSQYLVTSYLRPTSGLYIELPNEIATGLLRLLRMDHGWDNLRMAQDFAAHQLYGAWKLFTTKDDTVFRQSSLSLKKRRNVSSTIDEEPELKTAGGISTDLPSRTEAGVAGPSNKEQDATCRRAPPDKEVNLLRPLSDTQLKHAGVNEERMWKALKLAMNLTQLVGDGLPLLELGAPSEFALELKTEEGSLAIVKQIPIKRTELFRQVGVTVAKKKKKPAVPEIRRELVIPEVVVTNSETDVCSYMKPIRLNNKWVNRPARPRAIVEILRDPIQLEFFRSYLQYNEADTPLVFWLAVDDMRRCSEVKPKQIKINQILRRYVYRDSGARLDCTASVISELLAAEKVTPAMLLSAQACVGKSMENKWFAQYLQTFPQAHVVRSSIEQTQPGVRTWGKERTKLLWQTFVRTIVNFRRGILNPTTCSLFRDFLKSEIRRETEKARQAYNTALQTAVNSGGPLPILNIPAKKIVKGKLVTIDKLLCDLRFLFEVEKYRDLCDSSMEAATSGNYRPSDELLCEMKARTVVDCFIESEIQPKIQINIPPDMADVIAESFRSGIIDRALFHNATVSIFIVLGYFWKKFCTYRFSQIANEMELGKINARETLPDSRKSPDFMNIDLQKCRKIPPHGDDHMKFIFSMTHGLRLSLPLHREDHELALSHSNMESRSRQHGRHSRRASALPRKETSRVNSKSPSNNLSVDMKSGQAVTPSRSRKFSNSKHLHLPPVK